MSLKTKLLLGGIGGSFGLMVIFIVVMIATLMVLGIIDVKGLSSSSSSGLSYSDISSSSGYWWPIGSAETETDGGEIFARKNPVESTISSYFGPRNDPFGSGATYNHGALDISAVGYDLNEVNIIASKDGKVIYPSSDSPTNCKTSSDTIDNYSCGERYGNYVIIDHGNGIQTLYAHMYENTITVKAGDNVKQGQVIGKMGSSGHSTGMHLHFEVRLNGERVDPLNYVDIGNPRPSPRFSIGDIEGGYGGSSENQNAMCNILLNAGYSENAVAAVLTNISHEGGFLTNNIEDCYEINNCCYGGTYGYCVYGHIIGEFGTDEKYTAGVDSGNYPRGSFVNDHAGYGLIQWTSSDRKAGLYDLAKSEGQSIADIGVQTKHLFNELSKPSYALTMDAITSQSRSASDISITFCNNFESPRGGCSDRGPEAENKFLPYVKNGCQ